MDSSISAATPPDLTLLSEDELEKGAHHTIAVSHLKKMCNPWGSWAEQELPITQKVVRQCIADGRAELTVTPLWTDLLFGRVSITPEQNRDLHVQKIAYFVLNGFSEPISLEVGSQALGVLPGHLIEDGNHRFAAAIMRKDKTITAKVGGSCNDAKQMGLWAPNGHYEELERRWDLEQARRPRRPKG